jgi:hypothetical protein
MERENRMILQYRLPFDVMGLGCVGDTVVFDVTTGTLERATPLTVEAYETLARVIPQLHPVGPHRVAPDVAAGLVAVHAQPLHDARRNLRLA